MYFENFDDPELLYGSDPASGVSIADETLPCSWLNPTPAQWTILFLAVYRGLWQDLQEAAAAGQPLADVRRFPGSRQCCFLPIARPDGLGGGYFVYPVPKRGSVP